LCVKPSFGAGCTGGELFASRYGARLRFHFFTGRAIFRSENCRLLWHTARLSILTIRHAKVAFLGKSLRCWTKTTFLYRAGSGAGVMTGKGVGPSDSSLL